jgi:hypothetical protein
MWPSSAFCSIGRNARVQVQTPPQQMLKAALDQASTAGFAMRSFNSTLLGLLLFTLGQWLALGSRFSPSIRSRVTRTLTFEISTDDGVARQFYFNGQQRRITTGAGLCHRSSPAPTRLSSETAQRPPRRDLRSAYSDRAVGRSAAPSENPAGSWTLRWRETDSNRWSLAERKKASSGSSTPRVRLGPQGDKRAKPCSLLREPEHNIPAASHSGIACRQALHDYRHFP